MNDKRLKVLLATNNPHKVREMAAILGDAPVELLTLRDFPKVQLPPEEADTMRGNAAAKAVAAARQSGLPALADDSGLQVDALGGAPGIRSARFLGEQARDADRNAEILRRLQSVPQERRTARFRCAAAVALPDGTVECVEATCEGVIADASRGGRGFGYDPIFFLPERGKTMAQLLPEEKNRLSHRARALTLVKPILRRWAEEIRA